MFLITLCVYICKRIAMSNLISRIQHVISIVSPERLAFGIILCAIFLLPVFLVPMSIVPFVASKHLVIYIGVAGALACFLAAIIQRGAITIPYEYVFIALSALPVVYVVSALISPSVSTALVGDLFGFQTVVYVVTMVVFLVLVTTTFRDKNKIFYSYLVLFASFILIALYQIVKMVFGADALTLNVLFGRTANLVGTWYDLGVFMSLIVLLSLITLEMLHVGKRFRVLLYSALAVSFFFVVLVDFALIWILLALFSLVFFVYRFSLDRAGIYETKGAGDDSDEDDVTPASSSKKPRHTYVLTLSILAVSIIFLVSGGFGGYVSSLFGVNQSTLYPFSEALEVTQETLREFPLLGIGPNQFELQWLKHKPERVNLSQLWGLELSSAPGYVFNSLATVGIIGFLTWVVFLGLYVWVGFRTLFLRSNGQVEQYLISSSFIASLFLWIVACVYTPNVVIITLTFFFTGLFFAASADVGVLRMRTFNLFMRPHASFVTVMVLVLMLIMTVVFAYFAVRSVVASAYFFNGVQVFNTTGDRDATERSLQQALATREVDDYYRTLAQLYQIRTVDIMQTPTDGMASAQVEQARTRFQNTFRRSVAFAQAARDANPSDYRNWLMLAQVYQAVASLGEQVVYDESARAYEEARKRNPTSPGLLLARAQLDRVYGETESARAYIGRALELKNNYTEARFVLAQIALAENDTDEAIASLNAAGARDPNNPAIFFQLGVLYYNTGAYRDAIAVLDQALELTGDVYGNARYFRGLSYEAIGERGSAIDDFERLQTDNPENAEVQGIIRNLRRGRDPFDGLQVAAPAERALPVEEDEGTGDDIDTELTSDTATSSEPVEE